jgi:hypothetical protein
MCLALAMLYILRHKGTPHSVEKLLIKSAVYLSIARNACVSGACKLHLVARDGVYFPFAAYFTFIFVGSSCR